jgi:hypothetical protein
VGEENITKINTVMVDEAVVEAEAIAVVVMGVVAENDNPDRMAQRGEELMKN